MYHLDDIPHAFPFGEALWNLTNRLEQLRTLASTLADQYEYANGVARTAGAQNSSSGIRIVTGLVQPFESTVSSPPTYGESRMKTLPNTCPGLPSGRQLIPTRLVTLVDKSPQACKSWCPGLLSDQTAEGLITLHSNSQSRTGSRRPNVQDFQDSRGNAADNAHNYNDFAERRPSFHQLKKLGVEVTAPGAADRHRGLYKSDSRQSLGLRNSGVKPVIDASIMGGDWHPHFGPAISAFGPATSAGPLDFGEMKTPLLILRKIWKEETRRINISELQDVFRLELTKNTDKVVRSFAPGQKFANFHRQDKVDDSEMIDEMSNQEPSQTSTRCILHPVSSLRLSWCFMTALIITWDVLFVPMEAFPVPDLKFFSVIEWIITIFWTFDMVVTFRTGYMNGTKIEMRFHRIAVNYFKTWFVPDLLIVTVDWSGRLLTASTSGSSLSRITRAFRAIRSVRLLRLTKLQAVLHTIEDQVNSPALHLSFALVKMTTVLCFLLHFVTCLWFFIGDTTTDGWVGYVDVPACGPRPPSNGRAPIPEDDSQAIYELVMWYFSASRWVNAQANGRVDQDARRNGIEMGFTCLISVLGPMLFMSVFVSNITATMMELNTMAQSRRTSRLRLNQYLSGHQVSAILTARLKAHVRDHYDLNKQQEAEKYVLSILPKQLQHDLLYEVRAPTVVAHRFFQAINLHFPQAIKHVTMQALTPVLTDQDETIFETGDACNRMIFAYRGRFMYSQMDKETHQQCVQKASSDENDREPLKAEDLDGFGEEEHYAQEVGTGVWLSEAAIWLEWQNQGILTAINDGLFFCLEVDSFNAVVNSYMNVLSLVVAYALQFESTLKKQTELSDIIDMEFEYAFKRKRKVKKSMFGGGIASGVRKTLMR